MFPVPTLRIILPVFQKERLSVLSYLEVYSELYENRDDQY